MILDFVLELGKCITPHQESTLVIGQKIVLVSFVHMGFCSSVFILVCLDGKGIFKDPSQMLIYDGEYLEGLKSGQVGFALDLFPSTVCEFNLVVGENCV